MLFPGLLSPLFLWIDFLNSFRGPLIWTNSTILDGEALKILML
jgi:hypothetical protein